MTEAESKALKDFLLDISCLDVLDNRKDDINIFDVLRVTNTEIRHSNILAWLLNPNENHGLGDAFIREFITRVVQRCPTDLCDPFCILLQNYFTYQVYREANHMDIVLVSKEEKTVIIIENKIWSGESPQQLENYMNKSRTVYSECEQFIYVFLTPDGHDSSNPQEWISVSYEDVVNSLEAALKDRHPAPEALLIAQNYIKTIRKSIMKERDEALIKICNDIYNKHRTALRLIFDNVNIDSSADSEIICSELKTLADEGKIIYEGNNRWSFFTEAMDEFLPQLNEPDSSWGTNCVYWYWFEKNNDFLIIHHELGGWGITDEHRKRMNAIIAAAGKTADNFKYKRLFFGKEPLSQDNYEASLQAAVRKLVDDAVKFEKDVLKKAKAALQ